MNKNEQEINNNLLDVISKCIGEDLGRLIKGRPSLAQEIPAMAKELKEKRNAAPEPVVDVVPVPKSMQWEDFDDLKLVKAVYGTPKDIGFEYHVYTAQFENGTSGYLKTPAAQDDYTDYLRSEAFGVVREGLADGSLSRDRKAGLSALTCIENDLKSKPSPAPVLEKVRELLEFSANGCLVPPDGGSPTIQDHIDTAKEALALLDQQAAPDQQAYVPCIHCNELHVHKQTCATVIYAMKYLAALLSFVKSKKRLKTPEGCEEQWDFGYLTGNNQLASEVEAEIVKMMGE